MDKTCPHCGSPMHAQMVICIKCGGDSRKPPAGASPASPRPSAAAPAGSPRRSRRTRLLAIMTLVVTAAIIAGGLWARGFIRERAVSADHADFALAREADSLRPYEEYILRHPGGLHVAEAQSAVADHLAFKLATTNEEFEAYLAKFPDGRHAAEVKRKLDAIKAADLAALQKRQAEEKREKELAAYYASIRPKRTSTARGETGRSAGAPAAEDAGSGGERDEIKVYIEPSGSYSVSAKITNLNGSRSPKSPGKISASGPLKCLFISKAKPYDRIAGKYRVTATLKEGIQRATHTAIFTVTGKNNVQLSFRRPRKPKMNYWNVKLTEYTELRVTEFSDFKVERKGRVRVPPVSRH